MFPLKSTENDDGVVESMSTACASVAAKAASVAPAASSVLRHFMEELLATTSV
jgi:hypothetical protein